MTGKKTYATLIVLALCAAGIGALASSEAALLWLFPRFAALLGGELSVASLHGRLIGPMEATGLEYRAPSFTLRADRLSLDWQPAWLLGGTLHIHPAQAQHLSVVLPADTTQARATSSPATTRALHLPLRVTLTDAEITRLEISTPGKSSPTLIEHARVTLSALGNSVHIDALHIEAQESYLDISGRLGLAGTSKVDLQLGGRLTLTDHTTVSGKGQISGDRDHLKLTLRTTTPFAAQLNATLDQPFTDLRWNASLDIEELAAQHLVADWPAIQLRGKIDGHGSASRLQAEGDLDALGSITGQGHVTLELQRRPATTLSGKPDALPTPPDYRFAFGLDWRAVQLASTVVGPVHSPEGKLTLQGSPDKYTFSVTTRLDQWHATSVAASGSGDTRQLRGDARATLLGGTLVTSGVWRWAQADDWRVVLHAKNIDPAAIDTDWPGQLALDAALRGDRRRLRLDHATVSGTLRGQPVQLNTQLAIDGDRYTLSHLDARLGSATASASGAATNRLTFAWDIQAPDLSQLFPGARGQLSTHGTLDGPRSTPQINASINGERLAIKNYRADRLALQLDLDMQDKQDSSARLELAGVAVPRARLTSFTLLSQGRLHQHTVNLALNAGPATADLALRGTYAKNVWTGLLSGAELRSAASAIWRLEKPAVLSIGAHDRRMDRWCLHQNPGQNVGQNPGQVCAQGQWHRHAGWGGSASATHFPLLLIQPLFLADIGLSGSLDGEFSARANKDGGLSANADLRFAPGKVRYPATGDEQVQVGYSGAQAHMQIVDGRAQTHLALQLEKQGWLNADLAFPARIAGAPPAADASLRGKIDAALYDLSPVALFFPQFYQTRGTLTGTWRVDGTPRQPRLSGQLLLDGGSADIPRLGVHLRDTRLMVRGDGGEPLKIEGRLRSGKGALDLDGTIDLRAGGDWSTGLHLRGTDFELANTPEVFLLATPDLTLDARPHTLRVDGKIDIPEARIAPKDLARAALSSADVVIVTDDAIPAAAKWKIYSRVQLNLGEKIHFSGFNFKGDITGNIVVAEEPDRPTTALGELHVVKGEYRIYRQDLNIERGRLIFTSGLINDPGLDMRAARRTGDVLAGVQAHGTLKSPQLTLFSEPSMSDTDTLSYLMLGRPASQAGRSDGELLYQAASSLGFAGGELLARKIGLVFGIQEVSIQTGAKPEETALVIGTYLSPRLYINYGIGLLEPVNTFRMRYLLNKNWQFQSETGTHSGADVLYTIER